MNGQDLSVAVTPVVVGSVSYSLILGRIIWRIVAVPLTVERFDEAPCCGGELE